MIEYIYFVKCPNCEDEHFSFFNEAKDFALGCLSLKPIITQIEVNRNDFGECTDSCDLGTVWSWEDVMQDTEEPTGTVFSKDDLKCTEYDPEFAALDNSVDFEIDEIPDNFRKPITEAKTSFLESAIYEALDYLIEFSDIFPFPENIMGDSWEDLKDDIRYGVSSTFEIAEIILEYLDKDLAIGRKHPEIFEDDPQSELTLETYNKLQRAFDRAVAEESIDESCCKKSIVEDTDRKLKTWICFYDGNDVGTVEAYDEYEAMSEFEDQYADECFFDSWDHDWRVEEAGEDYVAVDESCKRKPIPEGMTIEQLVEEMEENEDTVECVCCQELSPKEDCEYNEKHGWICSDCQDEVVECTWCEELYDKSECRYEVDMGWLCDRCEAAIKSRGETLTFKEGNYWDFLDEDIESDSLTEDFPYFEYSTEDVKTTLIGRVLETPGMERFVNSDGTIRALLQIRAPHATMGYRTVGHVTGFDVVGTRIVVYFTRNDVANTGELDELLAGNNNVGALYRNSPAYQVLRTLKAAAVSLNRELNPGVAVRRDRAVANTVSAMTPEVLEELKSHIKDITFEIPYDGYVEQDLHDIDDQASERQVKNAVRKLKDLHNTFFDLSFADDAKVEIRYVPETEKVSGILSSWGNEGNIRFNCRIDQLSPAAQKVIEETRYSTSKLNKTLRYVSNYRLAKELCSRYGARFFE